MANGFGDFLAAWVEATPAAAAVLLTGSRMRVSPWVPRQWQEYPCAVYSLVAGQSDRTLTGPTGLLREAWLIDVHAPQHAAMRGLVSIFVGIPGVPGLDGYAGTLGGVTVRACLLENVSEQFDERLIGAGPDNGMHRGLLTFVAWRVAGGIES